MFSRYVRITAMAVLTACVAALGYASTASAGSSPACQKKKGGSIRLVAKKTSCKKSERKITIIIKGRTGPPGRDGANGTNGTNGAPGEPRSAKAFDVAVGVGTVRPLADFGDVQLRMFCVNDLTNVTAIEVKADNGISMSSAVYQNLVTGEPSTRQFPLSHSNMGVDYFQSFASLTANASGVQGNEGHVSGSIKTASGVVYVSAYMKTLPGPNACTINGTAYRLPIA